MSLLFPPFPLGLTGLFGEDPANRRERLRGLLSARQERGELLEAVEEAAIAATAVSIRVVSLLVDITQCSAD